ncbi:hypothetical protein [Dyadobacter sp. CY323]|uniref:hypothetical protein n=1 Tax=Dyadobacter sp. CY323 TaxID=2907302 RepID=UPI001F279528|nr:hypothetical protein [Dyadobacter sp. CY323]MCE6989170.1 hypothetical protein [Dyadobacter sp. CY323]
MKNLRILTIASFLLVLCVFEKEARNKAVRAGNVEKIYNILQSSDTIDPTSTQNGSEITEGARSLYDPSSTFRFASMDTTTNLNGSSKLFSQNLADVSGENKTLNY